MFGDYEWGNKSHVNVNSGIVSSIDSTKDVGAASLVSPLGIIQKVKC